MMEWGRLVPKWLLTLGSMALAIVLATAIFYPVFAKLRRRGQSQRPEGLCVISDPPNAEFEIIAVHGLGADPEHTWTRKVAAKTTDPAGGKQPDPAGRKRTDPATGHRVHLLRDLIKKDFPTARISNFAYNSNWLGDAPVKTAEQIANRFIDYLRRDRSGRQSLQTLFLAHSFGGIVIKEVSPRLSLGTPFQQRSTASNIITPKALSRLGDDSRAIADETHGILFLGTPHQGSAASSAGAIVASLTAFLGPVTPTLNGNQRYVIENLETVKGATFDSHADEYAGECLAGTCLELLNKISKWANDPTRESIYWLEGKAGIGKSAIARTVAGNLGRDLAASFFFKRGEGDRGKAGLFFTTLAAQLSKRLPAMAQLVRNAMDSHHGIAQKTLGEQFRRLLKEPLEAMNRKYPQPETVQTIVIDALDECDDERDVKVIISLLSQMPRSEGYALKFFLTSRDELPIRDGFKSIEKYVKQSLHDISPEMIEEDITIFLESRLKEIGKFRMAPDWPGQDQLQELIRMANPLFIAAATACRFIEDDKQGGDLDGRIKQILQYTAYHYGDLDKTYLPVLKQMISGLREPGLEKAKKEIMKIVGSIITITNPLPAVSLANLLGMTHADVNNRLQRLHPVLVIPSDVKAPVRIFHESFRDFLVHSDPKIQHDIWVDTSKTHKMLADRCLQLLSGSDDLRKDALRKDICGVKLPGTLRKNIDMQKIDSQLPPEVKYACLNWVHHLKGSKTKLHDGHQTLQFLRVHFLHWLEALSLLGKISESIGLVSELQSLVDLQDSAELSPFLDDARRFVLYCHSIVGEAPLQVYSSALLFAPKRSVIRQTFERHIDWVTTKPAVEQNWDCCLQTLTGHRGSVTSVAVSGDGRLASGSEDRTIKIWDATTGALQQTLECHGRSVDSVAFSSDGRLASSSWDATTEIWDAITGTLQQTLKESGYVICSVAFSSDGRLALGSGSGQVRILDATTGALQQTLKNSTVDRVNSVVFCPCDGGRLLAWGSDDKTVKIWDKATGELQTLEGHRFGVTSVAFSVHRGCRLLASGSDDKTIKVWDATTWTLKRTLEGHSIVCSVAFSSDGGLLASGSWDRTVKIWDAAAGTLRQTLEGHLSIVLSVAFLSNDRLLATGSRDETVKIWDMTTEAPQQTRQVHRGDIRSLAVSSDGRLVASGSDDTTVKIWVAATGALQETLEGHIRYVSSVAFSSDGRMLASASWASPGDKPTSDSTIRLWNTATWALQKSLSLEQPDLLVKLSSDARLLTSQSLYRVDVWDTANWTLKHTFKDSIGGYKPAMTGDGRLLAYMSNERKVHIWDTTKGELQQALEGSKSRFGSAAFSDDGRLLASASKDHGTVHIWDTTEWKLQQTLKIDTSGKLWLVTFSSDNSHVHTNFGRIQLKGPVSSISEQATSTPQYSSAVQVHSDTSLLPQAQACERPRFHGCGVDDDRCWITWNGLNVLWLPPEFRSRVNMEGKHQNVCTLAISQDTEIVVFGCNKGVRVIVVDPERPL
ncbi:hypothetical protein CDD83_1370 [Cordyceps sp. RAO-2017]|nr:hypothetical protein CDD83_1370 [Cordyceps sp. RAO-2017]